jgi:TadE-like protein
MLRAALFACLPWFAALVALVAVLWLLLKFCRPPVSWQRLSTLHRNETGGVQSLSFVITLPIFVMVMMLIVQVSQVMIANIVVQYAAFAAARSAVVWIPARVAGNPPEVENWITNLVYLPEDSRKAGYVVFLVSEDKNSGKWTRIHRAAALACMPIAPSRDAGGAARSTSLSDSAERAYLAVSPGSAANQRVPRRIANKLSYSLENTTIEIRRTTPDELPRDLPDPMEPQFAWLLWRDQITVTVTHQYALLPGPGRLLARSVSPGGPDSVSGRIGRSGSFYTIPIVATATLPNEGEVPRWQYVHQKADVVD